MPSKEKIQKRNYLEDFLKHHANAKVFFRASYLDRDERIATVKRASQKLIHPVVVAELFSQNASISAEVDASLKKVKNGSVAMVVTGQQVGFLGGPLQTFYKAMSAVKCAQILEKESGTPVVPLFWLQSEDHDFEEIKSAIFFGAGEETEELDLAIPTEKLGDSVGDIRVTEKSSELLSDFLERLDGLDEMKNLMKSAYAPGTNLAQAFASLLQKVFAPFGLLVFNPHSRPVKSQFKEFIASAFVRLASISNLLESRTKELSGLGYDIQVAIKPKSPLFFVSHEGRRQRLTETSEGTWKGETVELTKDDLFKMLDETPEKFTTSALIRPVFQDTIFPTAAYIAGPSEFNYWAQVTPLYEFYGGFQPLVVPRARFTIIEKKYQNLMEKVGARFEQLELEPQVFMGQRFHGTEFDPQKLFGMLDAEVINSVERLREIFQKVDANLIQGLEQTIGAVSVNLSKLKNKYERSLGMKEEAVVKQFQRLRGISHPHSFAQERVICAMNYCLRYGPDFLRAVYREIDLASFGILLALYLDKETLSEIKGDSDGIEAS